jgi:hypothetical protein
MSVILTSTTDTPEQVQQALEAAGNKIESIETTNEPEKKETEKKDPPADPKAEAQVAAAAPKDKTAGASGAPEEDTQEPDKKPSAKMQKRFDELTKEKHDALRETAIRDGRIQELERQLADKKPPETKPAEKVEEKQAEPKAKPVVADFENYDDFVEALSDWKADQREAKLQAGFDKKLAETEAKLKAKVDEAEAKNGAEAVAQEWAARVEEAKAELPDWDEVVAGAADVMISAPMIDAIGESDLGPHILHYLTSHKDEAAKIFEATNIPKDVTPHQQLQLNRRAGKELARIEALIEAGRKKPADAKVEEKKATASEATPAKPKTKAASAAPEPIEPVRPGASPTGIDPYDAAQASQMTPAQYREWRKAHPHG